MKKNLLKFVLEKMKKKLLKFVLVHPIFSCVGIVIVLSIISLCLSLLLVPPSWKFVVFVDLTASAAVGLLFLFGFVDNKFVLYCENCKEKSYSASYCIYCGGETVVKKMTEIEPPRRCLNGHKLDSYGKYCPKCGAPERKNE